MKNIRDAFIKLKYLIVDEINIIYSDSLINIKGNLNKIDFDGYLNELEHLKSFFGRSITLVMHKSSDKLDLGYGFENLDILYDDIKEFFKNNPISIEIIIDKKVLVKNLKENEIITEDVKLEIFYSKEDILKIFQYRYDVLEKKLSCNKINCFIIIEDNVNIRNNSICIVGGDYISNINLNSNNLKEHMNIRKNIIKLRNELCNWNTATTWLLPDDFYFDLECDDFELYTDLVNVFKKLCIDLIIRFIANFSGEFDGKFLSTISGSKRIDIEFNAETKDYSNEAYKNLYKLYSWIYEKYSFDKINICRNVISVLISAKWSKFCPNNIYNIILSNSAWLKTSVEDNFKKFLHGNVNDYFKEKNTIIKQIANEISVISNQIYELIKIINTNLISLIGIVIAGLVGYIAKGEITLVKILILIYVGQLDLNIILNIPLILIKFFQSNSDLKYKSNLYENTYIMDEQLKKSNNKAKFNIITFWIYLIIILLVVMTFNIIVYKVYTDTEFFNNVIKFLNINKDG